MEGPAELAPGVYRLGSDIVNWYLVEEEGRLTAVDAGLPAFAASLDADLDRIGFTSSDVEAVVLTHSDGDHIGIARELEVRGARVLIHSDDRETLPKGAPRGGDRAPRYILANLWRPPILQIVAHNLRRGGAKPPKVEGRANLLERRRARGSWPSPCRPYARPHAGSLCPSLRVTRNSDRG